MYFTPGNEFLCKPEIYIYLDYMCIVGWGGGVGADLHLKCSETNQFYLPRH